MIRATLSTWRFGAANSDSASTAGIRHAALDARVPLRGFREVIRTERTQFRLISL